jgi:type VI secretion system protein ImpH
VSEVGVRIEAARQSGFYPLVHLLERLGGDGGPVGTDASPEQEVIRFRHDPALAFSAADVVEVRELQRPALFSDPDCAERRGWEVVTTFLGLSGAVSPIPLYLSEEVAREDPETPQLRDFLDLFHHRLISLLYRARASRDVPNGWRRDGRDAWTPRLLALLGVDVGEPARGGALPAWRLLRLAPLLAERVVTADALEAVLEDALAEDLGGARVEIEPFAGAWVDIPAGDQVALGVRASRLGELVLGRRVYDAAGRFRVVIGPLTSEGHGRFTYGGALRRVTEVLDALVAEPLEREIVLWLAADAAPQLRLGASRLGRDAWLAGQPRSVRLRVDENAAVAENATTESVAAENAVTESVATENTVATEIAAVVENAATENVVAENVAVAAVVGQAA